MFSFEKRKCDNDLDLYIVNIFFITLFISYEDEYTEEKTWEIITSVTPYYGSLTLNNNLFFGLFEVFWKLFMDFDIIRKDPWWKVRKLSKEKIKEFYDNDGIEDCENYYSKGE